MLRLHGFLHYRLHAAAQGQEQRGDGEGG